MKPVVTAATIVAGFGFATTSASAIDLHWRTSSVSRSQLHDAQSQTFAFSPGRKDGGRAA